MKHRGKIFLPMSPEDFGSLSSLESDCESEPGSDNYDLLSIGSIHTEKNKEQYCP